MTESQFMVQVFNSLTKDYGLQIVLMEKRIGNKEKLLTIDEPQEEFSLRYERPSLVAEAINDIDLTEEKVLFTTQSKGKCRNCGKMSQKATDCKARRDKRQIFETQVICNYCKKHGYYKADWFKKLRKN
jgi:hypothetical protein